MMRLASVYRKMSKASRLPRNSSIFLENRLGPGESEREGHYAASLLS
jgi:hypothetical protein